jgi:hypothetical protein
MGKQKKERVTKAGPAEQPTERRAQSQRLVRAALLAAHVLTARERHEGFPHETGTRHHPKV